MNGLRLRFAAGVGLFAEGADGEQAVIADVVTRRARVLRMIEDRDAVNLPLNRAVVIDPLRRLAPASSRAFEAVGVDNLAIAPFFGGALRLADAE
jgi:hypothetical protein